MATGRPLSAAIVAEPLAGARLAATLFAAVRIVVLSLEDLRVAVPWRGRLFDEMATVAGAQGGESGGAAAVGLLVPVRWMASPPAPEAVLVADHVNLTLRGPLSGRRPDSGPQPFPSMAGEHQPGLLRPLLAGRVYSEAAVAGVAEAGRLTPFEAAEVARSGCAAVSDCLVDAVIVAAHHGVRVAACGMPQAPSSD